MKVSDYIASHLQQIGLRHIFLLPGGASMHLCDSVGKCPEIEYICCLHEQACAFAAESYAEFSDAIGACLVTAGPGSTNALTGAACAWIEGASVLFISGQAKRSDLMNGRGLRSMGPQEVDIISMARPVTKYAMQLLDPQRVRYELEKAIFLACEGRKGPVWLDIPLDVQAAKVEPATLVGFKPGPLPPKAPADLTQLVAALAKARRPIFYVGNGVRTSGASKIFRQIVEKTNIPVLLSWKAADLLSEDHPQYVGRPGAIGQRAANFVQQKADLIIVIGARLDLPSIAFSPEKFAPRALKCVVDIDSAELEKLGNSFSIKIHEDAQSFLVRFSALLPPGILTATTLWRKECMDLKARFPIVLPEYINSNGAISTYVLIDTISKYAEADDVIVPGSSGPCSDILMQVWRIKCGQRLLNAPGLGAMGTGLPATIGACLASGRRRVINVNGDGGFQLNIQELETVRRLSLPVKYFVLDNGGYRSIVAMQRNHFQGRLVGCDPSSGLTLPPLKGIIEGYGIKYCEVHAQDTLESTVCDVLRTTGPVVCVVKISSEEITAPRCTSEVRADGTIFSRAMEDMWPLLPREELAEIMDDSPTGEGLS